MVQKYPLTSKEDDALNVPAVNSMTTDQRPSGDLGQPFDAQRIGEGSNESLRADSYAEPTKWPLASMVDVFSAGAAEHCGSGVFLRGRSLAP